jgi:hypothetical protein
MGRATDGTAIRLIVGMAALFGWPGPAWSAPEQADMSVAQAPARTPDKPPSPGPAATIELTVDPFSEVAGGAVSSMVMARIRDSAGNLTDAKLELRSELATLGKPARFERGVYSALLTVPQGTRQEFVEITARADKAVARGRFPLATAAATVRVTPHGPFQETGSDSGQFEVLDVWVSDASGRPVSDAPKGSGGLGAFREAVRVGPGHWVLPYRPPRITEDTTEEVVIRAGAASTTVQVEVVASRVTLTGGAKAGVAFAGGGLGPAIGAEGGVWWRAGRGRLGLLLEVSWCKLSMSSTAPVGATELTYSSTQNFPAILLSSAWRTRLPGRWMLWATVGGGGGVVANSAKVSGQPTVSESGFAPVASGSLSVTPRLGKGAFFLEARGTWFGDPGLSTLSGSTTTFLALLGYRFDVD